MIFTEQSVASERRERFWRSMPSEVRDVCDELEADGLILFPTGSRVICPDHASPESDWDVVIVGEHDWSSYGLERHVDENGDDKYAANDCMYGCWRCGELNVISVPRDKVDRWLMATDFCMHDPRAITREFRVKVFQRFEV